jgi:hypothetical protein
MVAADEGALACDFMETYHIMDWRALPARRAALFAYGLREDARIRLKLSGAKARLDTMLLAMAVDALNTLVWQNTQAGHEGRDHPRSVLALLRGDPEPQKRGFDTPEEFDAWRNSLLTGGD